MNFQKLSRRSLTVYRRSLGILLLRTTGWVDFKGSQPWKYAPRESSTRDTVHLFSHGPSPARKAIGPERRRYELLSAEIIAKTEQRFDGHGIPGTYEYDIIKCWVLLN